MTRTFFSCYLPQSKCKQPIEVFCISNCAFRTDGNPNIRCKYFEKQIQSNSFRCKTALCNSLIAFQQKGKKDWVNSISAVRTHTHTRHDNKIIKRIRCAPTTNRNVDVESHIFTKNHPHIPTTLWWTAARICRRPFFSSLDFNALFAYLIRIFPHSLEQ